MFIEIICYKYIIMTFEGIEGTDQGNEDVRYEDLVITPECSEDSHLSRGLTPEAYDEVMDEWRATSMTEDDLRMSENPIGDCLIRNPGEFIDFTLKTFELIGGNLSREEVAEALKDFAMTFIKIKSLERQRNAMVSNKVRNYSVYAANKDSDIKVKEAEAESIFFGKFGIEQRIKTGLITRQEGDELFLAARQNLFFELFSSEIEVATTKRKQDEMRKKRYFDLIDSYINEHSS